MPTAPPLLLLLLHEQQPSCAPPPGATRQQLLAGDQARHTCDWVTWTNLAPAWPAAAAGWCPLHASQGALHPSRAKAASPPLRGAQLRHSLHLGRDNALQHQLRDAITHLDCGRERVSAVAAAAATVGVSVTKYGDMLIHWINLTLPSMRDWCLCHAWRK